MGTLYAIHFLFLSVKQNPQALLNVRILIKKFFNIVTILIKTLLNDIAVSLFKTKWTLESRENIFK